MHFCVVESVHEVSVRDIFPSSHSFQTLKARSPERPSPSVPQMRLPTEWRSRKMQTSVCSTRGNCASKHAPTPGDPSTVAVIRDSSCRGTEDSVLQVSYWNSTCSFQFHISIQCLYWNMSPCFTGLLSCKMHFLMSFIHKCVPGVSGNSRSVRKQNPLSFPPYPNL